MSPGAVWAAVVTFSLAVWACLVGLALYLGAHPMHVLAVLAALFLALAVLSWPAAVLVERYGRRRRARARTRLERWLDEQEHQRAGERWTDAELAAMHALDEAGRDAVARAFDRAELVDDPATVIEAGSYPPPPGAYVVPPTVTLDVVHRPPA